MIVFMLIVAEIMPATSEVIPLISIYYTGIMFEVSNWITFIFHQKAKPSLLSFEIYFHVTTQVNWSYLTPSGCGDVLA